MKFIEITLDRLEEISKLALHLNDKYTIEHTKKHFKDMFAFKNYHCFGLEENGKIIAITSGWVTVRLYCGKQLEVDNVLVDPTIQSKGIGTFFFKKIDAWAKERNFDTIELNTYVHNPKSHKFYFNNDYEIIGYHFQKKLNN